VTGPTHPLQERCDRAGRTELAHEIDVANVDAELKRCRCNEHLQLAVLQSLLGLKPLFLGEAAMVGGHVRLTQQLGEFPRGPLGHPPGVDEHERSAVLLD
jgi:alpha-D-ribose 1-methylphosphonate 5-triphosphate synthase subunit PhnG